MSVASEPKGTSSEILQYVGQTVATPTVTDHLGNAITLDYIDRIQQSENPLDRLFTLWKSTLFLDQVTHEAQMIHTTTVYGAVAGFTYGSIPQSTKYAQEFVRQYNEATFENKYRARRNYLDTMLWKSSAMGFKYAVKTSLLSGLISTAFFSSMCYRRDISLIDTTACTGVICGISRLWLGSRALLVGSLVGSTLGLIGGACIKLVFYVLGSTPQEYLYWNHASWKATKEGSVELAFDKSE